jgi:hypothetical protein
VVPCECCQGPNTYKHIGSGMQTSGSFSFSIEDPVPRWGRGLNTEPRVDRSRDE